MPETGISGSVMAGEASRRKARSEAIIGPAGILINPALPPIETEAEARIRSVEEVSYRMIALLVVATKGQGNDLYKEIVEDYGLLPHFTPKETAFILDPAPSERTCYLSVWRYEAAYVLLWALGYIDELGVPNDLCDVEMVFSSMLRRSSAGFMADAVLRTPGQILDEADLIYRYHWAVVHARINEEDDPPGLNTDVVEERHYALNWLIGYNGQEWDDISTDT